MYKHPLEDVFMELSTPAFQQQVKESLTIIQLYYADHLSRINTAEICLSITNEEATAGRKALVTEASYLLLSCPSPNPNAELQMLQLFAKRLAQ